MPDSIGSHSSIPMIVAMVFSLGLRHGLDLDHLATIDAISRTIKDNKTLSKRVGLLFSFGHGLVVIMFSLILGTGLVQQAQPSWLERFGTWVSILFLFLFGLITLYKVIFYQSSQSFSLPTGLKSYLFRKHQGKHFSPLWVMLVGALFALSFDTFTQVALFSLSMNMMAGWLMSLMLAVIFMMGMMASDGLNGFFIASLIQGADNYSAMMSRCFGLLIAGFSFVIATFEVLKLG